MYHARRAPLRKRINLMAKASTGHTAIHAKRSRYWQCARLAHQHLAVAREPIGRRWRQFAEPLGACLEGDGEQQEGVAPGSAGGEQVAPEVACVDCSVWTSEKQ